MKKIPPPSSASGNEQAQTKTRTRREVNTTHFSIPDEYIAAEVPASVLSNPDYVFILGEEDDSYNDNVTNYELADDTQYSVRFGYDAQYGVRHSAIEFVICSTPQRLY